MSKAFVDFSTRDFEICHLKKPRGLGSWAFQYKNEEIFFVYGTYSEAKKIAAQKVREQHPELSYMIIKVLG